ncbi:hypothetical protein PR048_031753 [Dryococelus australis]|uniref:Uncharacterized protein n=1 Tax=Dryococelus australis TaxID=614101 RepID=A0ABQ9GA58_9NEOP|nr:hypothetical protein PR048_031753 [Dryococelus australis]
MRDLGYDNGFNTKGKDAGVQKRLLDLNSRVFFMPCGNHSLNLVVNDAALSSPIAEDYFGIIQQIFNFFSSSTLRWNILVKPHQLLQYHIEEIYDAVYEASQYMRIDAFGRKTALGMAKKLQSFKFLCCLVTWYKILFKINTVSKALQKVTSDLQNSMDLVKSEQRLENMRSEEGLTNIITNAKELAERVGVAAEFGKETQVRPRKIKKDFSSEIEDEIVKAGRMSFKDNFLFSVLDTAISSLKERFELMENHSKSFKFLYDIENLQTRYTNELKDVCTHLHSVLSDGEECYINGIELFDEQQIFAPMLPSGSSPAKALSFLTKHCYMDTFPKHFGKRSFSKLKQIETYLRSTLSQERLSGLVTMTIENDLLNEMDTDLILNEFAKIKARKICF